MNIYILYLFIVLWTCVKTFVPKLDISVTSQDVQMFFRPAMTPAQRDVEQSSKPFFHEMLAG